MSSDNDSQAVWARGLMFACHRCKDLAEPRPGRRSGGWDARPSPPEGWDYYNLPHHAPEIAQVHALLCEACSSDLAKWLAPVGPDVDDVKAVMAQAVEESEPTAGTVPLEPRRAAQMFGESEESYAALVATVWLDGLESLVASIDGEDLGRVRRIVVSPVGHPRGSSRMVEVWSEELVEEQVVETEVWAEDRVSGPD